MSCSFMGPKLFSTFQIILVEYQLFSMGPHHFGQVQIIRISSENSNLNLTKMICTGTQTKQFGRSKTILDL